MCSPARLEGRQPRHVITSTLNWTPRITDGLRGPLNIDPHYNSSVEIAGLDIGTNRGFMRNPGHALISARIGLRSADGRLRGAFFVDDLTNQYYNITGFAVPEQTGNYAGYPGLPRFYGVCARLGF